MAKRKKPYVRKLYLRETKALLKPLQELEFALDCLIGDLQCEAEAEIKSAGKGGRYDNDWEREDDEQGIVYPENAAEEHDTARENVREALIQLGMYLTDHTPRKGRKGLR